MAAPSDDETQERARAALIERLRALGQSEQAIAAAEQEDRLATFAVEIALGGDRRHTLTGVAKLSGLSPAFLRRLMQASGRAAALPRERAYTDDDVELARRIKLFADAGIPREGLLETSRVIGQAMSQTAEAIRRTTVSPLVRPGDTDLTLALRYVEAAQALAPEVAFVLDSAFRTQLREGIRSDLVAEAERDAGRLAGTRDIAIAFADLVGYTKLGEQLPAERLGQVATRLAELATDSICRPTQLVKTIGDAVMLVSWEVDPMLETLRSLVAATEAEGEEFPPLRVGVAFGPATPRGGDWFGSTVNLASRVTDAGKPNRIYATEPVVELAGGGYGWKRSRRRNLKGIDGRTRLYALLPEASSADESSSAS
ncbi:MAG TPA: adenylate cyclase regulatory domain-containing protein [Thermoleophilaceae bacterium]|nr:adenylate cyclase regulatory domain-containing protein [Thermoleophilaceae bacterium]